MTSLIVSNVGMRNTYAPHIDFADLSSALGKMLPSNIDMIMERHGHFLVGEWKRENENFGVGQKILLNALSRVPNFTVLIIEGNTDKEMVVNKFSMLSNEKLSPKGSGVEALKTYLADWLSTK
jgi:hypothetical protein